MLLGLGTDLTRACPCSEFTSWVKEIEDTKMHQHDAASNCTTAHPIIISQKKKEKKRKRIQKVAWVKSKALVERRAVTALLFKWCVRKWGAT